MSKVGLRDDKSGTADDVLPIDYDATYEWPGESSTPPKRPFADDDARYTYTYTQKSKGKGKQPCFRLVVQKTSILSSKHRVAVVDGYAQLEIGRDIAMSGETPRLRLKEMEVSKLHATAYWDGARREWGIVDMGSKHGTFLRSHLSEAAVRLSPPRIASIPRQLRHLDELSIGSTQFSVHIHTRQIPCEKCLPDGGEIPFFGVKNIPNPLSKRLKDAAGFDDLVSIHSVEKDPRRALNSLKRNLLMRHQSFSFPQQPLASDVSYIDRAARRRSIAPPSHSDAPGTAPLRSRSEPFREEAPEPVISKSLTPLSSDNIGHRMLVKQGWTPGTALGLLPDFLSAERVALLEPLQVNINMHRVGLGANKSLDAPGRRAFI